MCHLSSGQFKMTQTVSVLMSALLVQSIFPAHALLKSEDYKEQNCPKEPIPLARHVNFFWVSLDFDIFQNRNENWTEHVSKFPSSRYHYFWSSRYLGLGTSQWPQRDSTASRPKFFLVALLGPQQNLIWLTCESEVSSTTTKSRASGAQSHLLKPAFLLFAQ